MFDLKRLSSGRTRKSWRIKNDHVEFLTFPYQPRQDGPDVIRDKAVLNCWKAVEGKILASPSQIVFRQIDVKGSRSNVCCTARNRFRTSDAARWRSSVTFRQGRQISDAAVRAVHFFAGRIVRKFVRRRNQQSLSTIAAQRQAARGSAPV